MCISILLIFVFVPGLRVVYLGLCIGLLLGYMSNHSTVAALLLDAIEGTPTILCKYHPLRIIVNLCGFLAVSLLVVHQQKNSLHHILGVVVIYFREIVLQLFDNFTISCQVRSAH